MRMWPPPSAQGLSETGYVEGRNVLVEYCDFSRPELEVLANSILTCSGSNPPPQPASQSLTHTDWVALEMPRYEARPRIKGAPDRCRDPVEAGSSSAEF